MNHEAGNVDEGCRGSICPHVNQGLSLGWLGSVSCVRETGTALADSLERGDLCKVQVKSKYGIIAQAIIRKVQAVMAVSVMWDIFRTIVLKIAQQEEYREGPNIHALEMVY